MATVRFLAMDADRLPAVCVKRGRPADGRAVVLAHHRPAWPLLLLPFSALAAVVGVVAGTRTVPVALPFSADVADEYRRWRAALLAGVATALATLAAGVVANAGSVAAAGAILVAIGAIGWVLNLAAHTCRVELDPTGRVITLRRCHRRFRDAVADLT